MSSISALTGFMRLVFSPIIDPFPAVDWHITGRSFYPRFSFRHAKHAPCPEEFEDITIHDDIDYEDEAEVAAQFAAYFEVADEDASDFESPSPPMGSGTESFTPNQAAFEPLVRLPSYSSAFEITPFVESAIPPRMRETWESDQAFEASLTTPLSSQSTAQVGINDLDNESYNAKYLTPRARAVATACSNLVQRRAKQDAEEWKAKEKPAPDSYDEPVSRLRPSVLGKDGIKSPLRKSWMPEDFVELRWSDEGEDALPSLDSLQKHFSSRRRLSA